MHSEVEDRARLLADLATALTAASTELDAVLDTAARADVELASDIGARVALAVAVAQSVRALRAEQENYRQILDTSLEGVWKIDRDGQTLFVNNRMAEILGVTVEDLVGQPFWRWEA